MRSLKPGYFTSDQLAPCSFAARIAFQALWCLADRDGRLEDRPLRIKAAAFPYDDVDMDALLAELVAAELIERYRVGNTAVIWVPTFLEHQRPHPNEPASKLPSHPSQQAEAPDQIVASPGHVTTATDDVTSADDHAITCHGAQLNGASLPVFNSDSDSDSDSGFGSESESGGEASLLSSYNARARPKKSRQKPEISLPEPFELADARRDYALKHGLSPPEAERQFERFRNHHLARGSVFRDWDAAWRTWVGRTGEFAPQGQRGGSNGVTQRRSDEAEREAERVRAKYAVYDQPRHVEAPG